MIKGLLHSIYDRVDYEKKRVKKVLPVLIRFGVSELEDLYHRFNHWRGACDHTEDHAKGPKRRKTQKVRRLKKKR